jgi:hypothetical protein
VRSNRHLGKCYANLRVLWCVATDTSANAVPPCWLIIALHHTCWQATCHSFPVIWHALCHSCHWHALCLHPTSLHAKLVPLILHHAGAALHHDSACLRALRLASRSIPNMSVATPSSASPVPSRADTQTACHTACTAPKASARPMPASLARGLRVTDLCSNHLTMRCTMCYARARGRLSHPRRPRRDPTSGMCNILCSAAPCGLIVSRSGHVAPIERTGDLQ